jgi:ribosome-binding protein aMBF1 (putative translation factor)
MIKNERQYRITKAQASKLEEALEQVISATAESVSSVHPRLQQAQADALRSQLTDLHLQLDAYDALRSQQQTAFAIESFEEFPRVLIQARIAAGMSQRQLAERLGIKEQQIQRYEATEYRSASWHRVSEVVRALGLKVQEEIVLAAPQHGTEGESAT